MANTQLLQTLLYSNTSEIYLRAGGMNQYVIQLQQVLRELGYERELMWSVYGADGYYGETVINAVRAFGSRAGVATNGMSVSPRLLSALLNQASAGRPTTPTQPSRPSWPSQPTTPTTPTQPSQPSTPASGGPLQIDDRGSQVTVSDGRQPVTFTRRDAGLAFYGSTSIDQAIDRNRGIILQLGITPSALNVMKSVSENEGKLDAINTYDRAYLSVGIFQWTVGPGDGPGELPALLAKYKKQFPANFQTYFGAHGLDVAMASDVSGYLILNGNRIDQGAEKEQFRSPQWAYRFWRAGQDPQYQAVQIEWALGRLKSFYWNSRFAISGFTLSEIITSEYGVALLLDHHVNRPAYVQPSVQQAMQQTGLTNPTFWGTPEEQRVLQAYLNIRATFTTGSATPMTKAHERAAVTKKYLDRGIISAERHSFHYSQQMVS